MCRIQANYQPTKIEQPVEFDDWFNALNTKAVPELSADEFHSLLLEPFPPMVFEEPKLAYTEPQMVLPLSPASMEEQPKRKSVEDSAVVDAVARKRAKQNEAAQRCRQKKQDQLNQFQETVKRLEQEKFDMAIQIAVLEKERDAFKEREAEMEKHLNRLEEQLRLSQSILMKNSQ